MSFLLRHFLLSFLGGMFPSVTLASSGFEQAIIPLRGTVTSDLVSGINTVANAFLVVTTTIALIVLVIAGLQYILSQGDEEKVDKSKKTIFGAVAGLLIIGLSGVAVNFLLDAIPGGGGRQPVAVVPGGGSTLRKLSVSHDGGEFTGTLPGEQEGGGGELPGNLADKICKPCQLKCLVKVTTETKELCNEPWSLTRDGVRCVCNDPAITTRDGLTKNQCETFGLQEGQEQEICGQAKYTLVGDRSNNCKSNLLTDAGAQFTSWGNGQCLPLEPSPPPPKPSPKPPKGCLCQCQAVAPPANRLLCRVRRNYSDCRPEDRTFRVRVTNPTEASCAALDEKRRCTGYANALRDSRLEAGLALNCAPG